MLPGTEDLPEQRAMVATPLPHCIHGVTAAQERGGEAGEQKGKIVAAPMPGAGIRDGGEDIEQAEQAVAGEEVGSLLIAQGIEGSQGGGRLHGRAPFVADEAVENRIM